MERSIENSESISVVLLGLGRKLSSHNSYINVQAWEGSRFQKINLSTYRVGKSYAQSVIRPN